MSEKLNVVNAMVAAGYWLANETPEQFAARFTLNQLKFFLDSFLHYKATH